MYLSHNIVNLLVRAEIAATQLLEKQKLKENSKLVTELLEKKEAETIFYYANDIGVKLTINDAMKVAAGKKIETEDFRGQLISNIKDAFHLVNSIAGNKNITINAQILQQINHTLGRETVEEWKLKFRSGDDRFSILYDNLTSTVSEIYQSTETMQVTIDLLEANWMNSTANRIYIVSTVIYELLRLHPFITLNKFTIGLTADMLFSKKLGLNINLVNLAELFTQKKSDIERVFSQQDEASREVGWHELFIGFFAERLAKTQQEFIGNHNENTKINKPFLDLNKRQLKILKYLQTIPTVKREDYVQMMDVSAMTAYRDLDQLLKHKLIKISGKGRGTKYMLYSR